MSLISYANSILNEDLSEIGLKRKKGLEWYKLIDNMFYVNVLVRKTGPILWVNVAVRSLLAPLEDSDMGMDEVDGMHWQSLLCEGKPDNQIFLEHLVYIENDEGALQRMKTLGHRMIEPIKPVLLSVHDLQSCYEAKNMLAYMMCRYSKSKSLGRDISPDEVTTWPPLDCFFILCKLGRYDDAADYIRRELADYEQIHAEDEILPILLEEERGFWMPYVRMVENGEYDRINEIMLKNYNENCDILEKKHKIKIDRNGFSCC